MTRNWQGEVTWNSVTFRPWLLKWEKERAFIVNSTNSASFFSGRLMRTRKGLLSRISYNRVPPDSSFVEKSFEPRGMNSNVPFLYARKPGGEQLGFLGPTAQYFAFYGSTVNPSIWYQVCTPWKAKFALMTILYVPGGRSTQELIM